MQEKLDAFNHCVDLAYSFALARERLLSIADLRPSAEGLVSNTIESLVRLHLLRRDQAAFRASGSDAQGELEIAQAGAEALVRSLIAELTGEARATSSGRHP